MTLPKLRMSIPHNQLCPDNAAYAARADLNQTRMLGYTAYNRDAVTTLLLGLLENRPAVRHVSGVTEQGLKILDRTGIEIAEDMRVYETGQQANQHTQDLIDDGFKLFWAYPPKPEQWPEDSHLVSPDLWARLNAKRNLADLLGAQNLPTRTICSVEELAETPFERPVFLTYAGGEATGWGFGVRYCDNEADYRKAIAWFKEHEADQIAVEQSVDLVGCWCVNVAVTADNSVYCGAALQTFNGPAQQKGSVIDPSQPVPQKAIDLALKGSEAARMQGFLGLCAFDVGLGKDGKCYGFDPNFRFNACSTQIQFHQSAADRSGLNFSQSWAATSSKAPSEIEAALSGPIDDMWLVPTRFIDGNLLSTGDGKSLISGFIMAENESQADRLEQQLAKLL
ncbi:MAG: hypothetical protein AAGF28_02595 [Pseudomonadota bacterium]